MRARRRRTIEVRAAVLGALVAGLTLSCTASHPPETPIEVGDFERDLCAPISESLCARAEACGCGELLHGGVLDHDACVAAGTARCLAINAQFVEAGVVVDRRLVREHLAELAALAPCEDVRIPWERGLAFFPRRSVSVVRSRGGTAPAPPASAD